MRSSIRCLVAVAFAASLVAATIPAAASQAESQNVRTIAGILAKLNHFPNDAEKTTLRGIVDSASATAHEKTLAQALVNMQHAVGAADKPKVEALAQDASAPASVRTIAGILARVNHTASEADKAALTKLAAAP